jgi:penicillin-binding protein 1A
LSRKIREAILAYRLEKTLSKKEILEIYLNEVYLGNSAYGVESAARTYFGKSCGDLTVAEAALLAGLVAGPSKYAPTRNLNLALDRRAIVLAAMLRHGFISQKEYSDAQAESPTLMDNLPEPYQIAPYFTETVRQYIVQRYGEDRLYNEGLEVRTTCDLNLQKNASEALINGIVAWETRQGRPTGLVSRLKPSETREFLNGTSGGPYRPGDLVQAVVMENHPPQKTRKKQADDSSQECTLAIKGDFRFRMQLQSKIRYKQNDLLEFLVTGVDGTKLTLEHQPLPPIQGAVVCLENETGHVKALVGGVDFDRSSFNRAVQAMRQPGSAFKPFVYAAALEWGMYSPDTVVVDEPIAIALGPRDEHWVPTNADGQYLGPIDARHALVHSRNAATVKVMLDVGIDSTIAVARAMGIQSPLGRNPSICLGASEVTPLELTAAYSVFPNLGMRVHPVLVEKVVDRFGRVLEDNTPVPVKKTAQSLNDEHARSWMERRLTSNQESHPAPAVGPLDRLPGLEQKGARLPPAQQVSAPTQVQSHRLDTLMGVSGAGAPPEVFRRPEPVRVISPQTAYLMMSMLRDVCRSGTGARVSRLRRNDLAGKTGTTDDSSDAWFIGCNAKFTAGVWVGYDTKVSLGRREHGSVAALPVWMDFMKEALSGTPQEGYPPPPGIAFLNYPGSPGPRRQNLAALLESGPVPSPELLRKQVSLVDLPAEVAAASGELMEDNPYTVFPMAGRASPFPWTYGGFTPGYSPGFVRVLSPEGETLGYAPYSVDSRGKMVVLRDPAGPAYERNRETESESLRPPPRPERGPDPVRSLGPWAGILGRLRQLLPPSIRLEFH